MTLGVRGVVENAQGEVLLVRHTYTKGLFLPGGGVERGETTDLSLRRELEEEGGVRITGVPELIGVFSNHRVFRNDHVLLYRVARDAWSACGDPVGREIAEILWCDPMAPPTDVTPGTQRRLRELFGGEAQSLMW
jgi:8-oxo-dGTP pyrophosphatase MutT (NUDIX family)